MISMSTFEKLKKVEMTSEYVKLKKEYEELNEKFSNLQNDYDYALKEDDTVQELKEKLYEVEDSLEGYTIFEKQLQEKVKDIKFGNELQQDIIKKIVDYAKNIGLRFTSLDVEVSAEEVQEDLTTRLDLSNKIADSIIEFFEFE